MKSLSGKHICVLLAHESEDVELFYPLLQSSEEGAAITVATLPKARHFHTRPAICHGPQVLISVDRMYHTDLVRNGSVITGRVPDDLPEFCEEIIAYFQMESAKVTGRG